MTLWSEIEENCSKSKSLNTYMSVIKARKSKRGLYLSLKRYFIWCRDKSLAKTWDDMLKGTRSELEERIRTYIESLNPLVARAVMNHLYYAVRTYYVINDIILNWDKLKRFKNPQGAKRRDRAYTKEEIERMLAYAKKNGDMQLEIALLILASSGIRVGALTVEDIETALEAMEAEQSDTEVKLKPLPILRLRDLKWFASHKLFGLRVYAEHDEEYITFISPQASQQIIASLEVRRKKFKERITENSYLLLNRYHHELPVPMKTLQWKLMEAAKAVGIRKAGKSKPQAAHGCRKYVETTAFVESGVDPRKLQMLLGHTLPKQDVSYFKPTPEQLLIGTSEAKGYIYALDAVTFKY